MGEWGVGLRSEPAAVDPGWIFSTTFTFTGKPNTAAGSAKLTQPVNIIDKHLTEGIKHDLAKPENLQFINSITMGKL